MADEALACFTSLLERVPGWIAELENILKSANERQNEFRAADLPSTPVAVPKRRTSKSSSMKSKRSKDGDSTSGGGRLRQRLSDLNNIDVLRTSHRKRKSTSEISGDHSGPSKFRVRSSGAIYYDGSVQKSFEQLVRGVGASRNTIRKGKMGAKLDSLTRTGSSSSDGSSESDEFSPMTANLHFKSSRPRPRMNHTFARDDGTAAFDRVDGRLEKAQALCERAAHQLLRDGDCTPEVNSAREHLHEALKIAESEIPEFRRRAEKAAERQRKSEERRRADEEAEERLRSSDTSLGSDSKDDHIIPSFPSEGTLEVDELEIDQDDDGEDEMPEFNIRALPLGKITQYRSMRMPAPAYC